MEEVFQDFRPKFSSAIAAEISRDPESQTELTMDPRYLLSSLEGQGESEGKLRSLVDYQESILIACSGSGFH